MLHRMLRPAPEHLYWRGASEGAAQVRWLGAAGFTVTAAQRTLALDPYLSRPGPWTLLTAPLVPDAQTLAAQIPCCDAVLVGHTHFDHALDAPLLAQQTGARLVGSMDLACLAQAAGVQADQVVACAGLEEVELPGGVAVPLPTRHGRVYFGRVPLPGRIRTPPAWPPRMKAMPHGQVFTWWVRWQGLTLAHVDSADYNTALLQGRQVDLLCLCAIGRRHRRGYTDEILRALRPRWVVACHWEDFFAPFGAEARQLPGVDLPGFVEEIRRAGAEPVVLRPGATLGLS